MAEKIKLPLLRDHHSHPLLYASMAEGVELNNVSSIDQAIRRINENASHRPDGSLVVGFGWKDYLFNWTEAQLQALPPMAIFNLSLHALRYNRAGKEILVSRYGDVVNRLEDHRWYEANLRVVLNWFANLNATAEGLIRFYNQLESLGVGYAEELLLVDENEINLFEQAGLTDRTRFWSAPDTYNTLSKTAKSAVAGLKLFTDGAFGARSAALNRPFIENGVRTANRGLLINTDEALRSTIETCLDTKNDLAVHAIGDRAISQTLSVLESIDRTVIDRSKIRLEHVQLIDLATARRAKELGLILSMQPNFTSDSVHYADRLDAEYLAANNPFRMLIDEAGFVPGEDLIFGSDGMPHGIEYALEQALFPAFEGQQISLEEFKAAYCMPQSAGELEVLIDHDSKTVRMFEAGCMSG